MKERYDSFTLLMRTARRISDQFKLPIVLPPICQALGVTVERSKTTSARALLLNARTKPRIVLNAQFASGTALSSWERFLIAHEIGHLVLHRSGIPRPKTPSEYWETEELCDAFARALLLPDRLAVLPVLEQGTERILRYFQFATRLGASAHVDWATAAARIVDWDNRVFFLRLAKDDAGRYVVRFTTLRKNQEIGRKPDAAVAFFEELDLGRPVECDASVKAAIPALQNATALAVRAHSDIRIGGILAA